MTRMIWIPRDDGGVTIIPAAPRRATRLPRTTGRIHALLRAVYCHEQAAIALYTGLARRTPDPARQALLDQLVQTERQQIARRFTMFARLNLPVPPPCPWWERALRHALLQLGPRAVFAWIRFVKTGDVRRQLELAQLLSTPDRRR